MIPLPDLLFGRSRGSDDIALLEELLELAFLGRNENARIHAALGGTPLEESRWQAELFGEDIFLSEFVDLCSTIRVEGQEYEVHKQFLTRVLANPPSEVATVQFRQAILRELETDAEVRTRVETLYRELSTLMAFIKSAHSLVSVDNTPHRLRMLVQARAVIDSMASDFSGCASGLRSIHEAGVAIQATSSYEILRDLLNYEDRLASLKVSLQVGADGRIKRLQIEDFEEDRNNRFYKPPLRRWRDMFQLYWRGYSLRSHELVNRVIVDVYMRIAPALSRVLIVLGHLEVYLATRAFADRARARGLDVSLAEVTEDGAFDAVRLFNPLLLRQEQQPVPCDIGHDSDRSITVITGPNSGGKTRLLQGLGLLQLLAQAGLYVPAERARVPIRNGLFASLVQSDSADQLEGRLGTELVRIRTLFQNIRPRSMVLLDELCSGTNPSEAAEIVLMVLRLLDEMSPRAFITTHFLDLARELEGAPNSGALAFRQVHMDDAGESTYQFVDGVAGTSMAAETARRLGVDFEVLSDEIRARLAREDPQRERRPVRDGD